jgi:hypothetical protein
MQVLLLVHLVLPLQAQVLLQEELRWACQPQLEPQQLVQEQEPELVLEQAWELEPSS